MSGTAPGARADIEIASLPATAGAYVLVIEAAHPVRLDIRTLDTATLPPGRYAYAGSARGPGGIRARVARHLRAERKSHWHIDRLTATARVVEVRVYPGGHECDLVAGLLAQPGAHVPAPGFGSSDCRNCAAHLVALP